MLRCTLLYCLRLLCYGNIMIYVVLSWPCKMIWVEPYRKLLNHIWRPVNSNSFAVSHYFLLLPSQYSRIWFISPLSSNTFPGPLENRRENSRKRTQFAGQAKPLWISGGNDIALHISLSISPVRLSDERLCIIEKVLCSIAAIVIRSSRRQVLHFYLIFSPSSKFIPHRFNKDIRKRLCVTGVDDYPYSEL